ncbi:DNA glycosylase/AP lyase ROS1 [Trifolium repens]|nr:DNA glycosylase/AP lyase ROS1 [Trifolium repens]
MRARFPLIETYFQDNEVFADYASMVRPINVPRNWMWNLQRWIVYFGTVSSILRDVVVMLGVALMLLGIQWVVAIMDQW